VSQVLDRGAEANASGAEQVLDRGAQAATRAAARCVSQVLTGVPGPLPAAPQRPLRIAAMLPRQEKSNSADVQRDGCVPRGDVPGRLLRVGRATADACWNRSYTACACGINPRRGPPLALPWANITAAVENLGVGVRRPCRGQTCGGMLGTMARIVPARPDTRPAELLFRP